MDNIVHIITDILLLIFGMRINAKLFDLFLKMALFMDRN